MSTPSPWRMWQGSGQEPDFQLLCQAQQAMANLQLLLLDGDSCPVPWEQDGAQHSML